MDNKGIHIGDIVCYNEPTPLQHKTITTHYLVVPNNGKKEANRHVSLIKLNYPYFFRLDDYPTCFFDSPKWEILT
jgi:hypothetical protein